MVTASGASGHSRVRRALLFLTVVWSIGAAFLALEASLTELSSLGSSKVLPANIVLPRQSKASLMHCEEVVKGLSPPPQDANVAGQASYLAWSLGYLMGSADASITSGVANRAAGENVLRRSLPVTTFLGIPPLALPKHGRSAYALREFSEFLEEDTPCVATALQFRHSPKLESTGQLLVYQRTCTIRCSGNSSPDVAPTRAVRFNPL
jgi:hypothetical protein